MPVNLLCLVWTACKLLELRSSWNCCCNYWLNLIDWIEHRCDDLKIVVVDCKDTVGCMLDILACCWHRVWSFKNYLTWMLHRRLIVDGRWRSKKVRIRGWMTWWTWIRNFLMIEIAILVFDLMFVSRDILDDFRRHFNRVLTRRVRKKQWIHRIVFFFRFSGVTLWWQLWVFTLLCLEPFNFVCSGTDKIESLDLPSAYLPWVISN